MEEKSLVKRKEISFVSDALQTLEKAQEWAKGYLDSKLAPSHFYEKDPQGNVQYDKGNVGGLLAVVAHGHDVGMTVSQAIQQIVPINGLTSIKGDGAKALILASGKCIDWQEETTGEPGHDNYTVTITSKRVVPARTASTSFSVADAKRAGLWVTPERMKNKPGLRYSPWHTYPERMVKYRAIGFHARDMYPDVMQGLVTEEEARDYPPEGTTVIEKPNGTQIHVDPTDATLERSGSLTDRLAHKITAKNILIKHHLQQREQENLMDLQQHVYTEDELKAMGQGIFAKVKKEFPELNDILESIVESGIRGKKSRDMWRKGVLAWQRGEQTLKEVEENYRVIEPPKEKSQEQQEFEKAFGADESISVYHDVPIPVLPADGERTFDDKRKLFVGLNKLGINAEKYKELADELVDEQQQSTFDTLYPTLDDFAKRATVEQVLEIINVHIEIKG